MKKIKVFCEILTLISLVFCMVVGSVSAASSKDTPVYLKLGKFFILYTYPSSPFIDQNNRLMVPLNAVKDLMGGDISYSEDVKKADINLIGHHFELKANSLEAIVDGKTIKLDSPPVIKSNRLYISIGFLLRNTNLVWTWDQNRHLLNISDERAVKGTPFDHFIDLDRAQSQDDNALQFISCSIETKFSQKSGTTKKIIIRAKNVSGHDIPEGKADINPLISDAKGYSVDSYIRSSYPPLPAVKKDCEVTKSIEFSEMAKTPIEYIICPGRELK